MKIRRSSGNNWTIAKKQFHGSKVWFDTGTLIFPGIGEMSDYIDTKEVRLVLKTKPKGSKNKTSFRGIVGTSKNLATFIGDNPEVKGKQGSEEWLEAIEILETGNLADLGDFFEEMGRQEDLKRQRGGFKYEEVFGPTEMHLEEFNPRLPAKLPAYVPLKPFKLDNPLNWFLTAYNKA